MRNATDIETEVEPIGVRRRRLERQLADLRRARGQAVADGKKFDSAKITAVEGSLAELDDAAAELERREAARSVESNRAGYAANVAAYEAARERRLDATATADGACQSFAAALSDVEEAVKAERAAHDTIANSLAPGQFNQNAEIVATNFDRRLWAMCRVVLAAATGKRHLGPVDLSPLPDDLRPDVPWRDAEAKRGSMVAYFRRLAPG